MERDLYEMYIWEIINEKVVVRPNLVFPVKLLIVAHKSC